MHQAGKKGENKTRDSVYKTLVAKKYIKKSQ
ncbi:MAG: hypothetical protein UX87_C0046G0001, partial [Candidatus Amesbacteria bacterium GW2011_GWA1_47_16]